MLGVDVMTCGGSFLNLASSSLAPADRLPKAPETLLPADLHSDSDSLSAVGQHPEGDYDGAPRIADCRRHRQKVRADQRLHALVVAEVGGGLELLRAHSAARGALAPDEEPGDARYQQDHLLF